MAIENTYLLGKNITLGCGFDLQAKAPLDSRQVVPAFAGLQALIDGNAAYEGMIVFDEETKKTYQAQTVDGVLTFREFGINEAELRDLIASETTAAMEFKGAATALPENPAKGDMYKVTATFKVGEEDAKVGDSIVYDGEQWFIIPSGDDIEDTWRPVTDVDNDATLTFVAGDKLEKTVAADGTITYKHAEIDAPTNMNEEGDERTRTYITQLITDNHGHIIGFKTATENVEDTNTTYAFEGQSDEATSVYFQVKSSEEEAAEVIYLNAYSKNEADEALANAVAEVKDDASNKVIAALAEAQAYADGKDAAIEAAQKAGDDAQADITAYKATNAEALATKVDKEAYEADKATFAIAETVNAALDLKANAVDVVANDTFEEFKTANTTAIGEARTGAVADVEAKGYAVATEVAETYATKTELENVDKKFENYVTAESYATDKAAIDKAIEDEAKARTDADAGFETRIAALEGNFGDGEGTVEAQIAAAVAAEAEIARAAEKANADDIDALEGRMDTAEGKITALETESAKHATKDELADVDAKFADYTKTADLPTDLGDFTNNAGYAKTADVNTELGKKADKTQVATDIANAIAPLATTEALNGVKATAEAATTVEEVDAQIDAKIGALNLATTYEPIGAEDRAKGYVDQKFTDANLDQYTTEDEVKSIVDDVIKTATDKETLDSLVELVEYIDTHSGDAINMATAIGVLEGKVDVIEKKPAYEISATQISNWDNEVGAKALAETKTTTAEVKAQIEAYGYATTGELAAEKAAREAKEAELATAIETAKTDAANNDVVVLSEAQKYSDQTKAEAIADAEGKVNALAGNVYAKEQTYTKAEVEALISQAHTWGEF